MHMKRRDFMQVLLAGLTLSPACRIKDEILPPDSPADTPPEPLLPPQADEASKLFWIKSVPDQPFGGQSANNHVGVDALIDLMAGQGLSFYKIKNSLNQSEAYGLIASDDVVLIKVNAQWKYRGCTNSDLVRGLIQRILDHPDGFRGEVVIIENGQGRGSLNCDTHLSYGGDRVMHANANDPAHSFLYLVNTVFKGSPVSARLLDPIRRVFIKDQDHVTEGFRRLENVSYPCFTTDRGNRVELREGIWSGGAYRQNLKLINVPVLKHHDVGGSEITASLKHFYGILSMNDGLSKGRHYSGLGETCGKMVVAVRPPVLHVIDAIWVSHQALKGFPEKNTFRANQILASQDPVALDYWAAKNILYPHHKNSRHHPDFAGIATWLEAAKKTINDRGGIFDPERGIRIDKVTKNETEMECFIANAF
jgi:uncharacterized protein (DUF362 family)